MRTEYRGASKEVVNGVPPHTAQVVCARYG